MDDPVRHTLRHTKALTMCSFSRLNHKCLLTICKFSDAKVRVIVFMVPRSLNRSDNDEDCNSIIDCQMTLTYLRHLIMALEYIVMLIIFLFLSNQNFFSCFDP